MLYLLQICILNLDSSQKDGNVGNGGNEGVLLVSKDSENLRDVAYKEYGVIVKEENNVTEEVLVRDVLYACQGIDERYVLFDKSVDGYILSDSVKVKKSVRVMVRKLCELGWLFRKVKGYVDESVERFCDEDVGTVGDECDFVGVGRRDIVSGQDIMVEQRQSRRSLITVGGVDFVVPGMFYGRDIVVHGLEGILEYRSHSINPPPASSVATNMTVSGASLSVAAPVAPNQAPVMTRAKQLELSSEGMYGVSLFRESVGGRLRHFSLADYCSVADNGGHLVDDVDLREVHGESHMIWAANC
ncbi:gamma-tubulin complex component 3 [Tanacetum coccineum]